MNELITNWGYALQQTLQGQLESGSIAAVLVVFAAGVLTSFTPCVYPMIPVTVSFIGGAAGGNRRRAVMLSDYMYAMAALPLALEPIQKIRFIPYAHQRFHKFLRTWESEFAET